MKHYCRNCRWFARAPIMDFCFAPELGIEKDYIYGDKRQIKYANAKDYPNNKETNGCTYYKPKFLVKLFRRDK